jgi:hypothetical protein
VAIRLDAISELRRVKVPAMVYLSSSEERVGKFGNAKDVVKKVIDKA